MILSLQVYYAGHRMVKAGTRELDLPKYYLKESIA